MEIEVVAAGVAADEVQESGDEGCGQNDRDADQSLRLRLRRRRRCIEAVP